MTDLITIVSADLTARINPLGAELWSLTDWQGREWMTDADPAFGPLREYLKLHGVVGVERVELPEGPEGETLLRTACSLHASILVAGAYGHTRLREAVFGGATRTFIEATNSPSLLLAH